MSATDSSNGAVIDLLVDAYNAGDARAFADLFADDAPHGVIHSNAYLIGRDAIYSRYVEIFSTYPQNRSDVVHRIAFGPFVIDHERVRRSPDAEPFDVIAIYTLESGLIKRLDFVRA
jgi:hypothetical protein